MDATTERISVERELAIDASPETVWLLRFSHRDLPSAEAAESHAYGWDHYFERLAVVAAGGDPGPDPWLDRPMD